MTSASVTTTDINQYYPTLQPLLGNVQKMVPNGSSTSDGQKNALQEIAYQGTAEDGDFRSKLASSLNDQVSKYIEVSHRLNDYNEIYNTNSYIDKELKTSKKEITGVTQKLKNRIYSSKQKSQLYEYEKNKLSFYKSLFLVSCFVIVDLITLVGVHLQGVISEKTLYVVTGVSAGIYLLIVFVLVYANSFRTHTDWNKFYWESMNKDKNSMSCK